MTERPCSLLVHAQRYALDLGFTTIPVKGKEPAAGVKWKEYQTTPIPLTDLPRLFAAPQITGLAVILGQVSHYLCCRDFDKIEAFEAWQAKYGAEAKSLPIARTGRGAHVYFRAKSITNTTFSDGELKGKGTYAVLPPSKHIETGKFYEWLREPNGKIAEIDPNTFGLATDWGDITQRYATQDYTEVSDVSDVLEVIRGEGKDSGSEGDLVQVPSFSITTPEEAVAFSLATEKHRNNNALQVLNRGALTIKAHLEATGCTFDYKEIRKQCFLLWYEKTGERGLLRPGQTKAKYWTEFDSIGLYTKFPIGGRRMEDVFERATQADPPTWAVERFDDDPQILLFCTFIRELHTANGKQQFFLPCRTLQGLFGVGSFKTIANWINALRMMDVIVQVDPGSKGKRISPRYVYKGGD